MCNKSKAKNLPANATAFGWTDISPTRLQGKARTKLRSVLFIHVHWASGPFGWVDKWVDGEWMEIQMHLWRLIERRCSTHSVLYPGLLSHTPGWFPRSIWWWNPYFNTWGESIWGMGPSWFDTVSIFQYTRDTQISTHRPWSLILLPWVVTENQFTNQENPMSISSLRTKQRFPPGYRQLASHRRQTRTLWHLVCE